MFLGMEGPWITIRTEVGQFPDQESAEQKARETLGGNPLVGFAVEADDGRHVGWIADSKSWSEQQNAHERLGNWMQRVYLPLLSWLAAGWLNDGFFARSTLLLTAAMTFLFLLVAMTQNRVESFVVWIIVVTLGLLAIPTFPVMRAIRDKKERQRAAERPTPVPARPSPSPSQGGEKNTGNN